MGVGRKELILLIECGQCRMPILNWMELKRDGGRDAAVGSGHNLTKSRTQIILLLDTKLLAPRRATIALGEQPPLSESKTFLESAKFSFDNLGPMSLVSTR